MIFCAGQVLDLALADAVELQYIAPQIRARDFWRYINLYVCKYVYAYAYVCTLTAAFNY